MERRIILRGLLAGAVGGLLAFVFARIFAEPVIDKSIAYESGRDAAQAALDKAAGVAPEAAGPDIFSRAVQQNLGLGTGMIAMGVALGGIFAVAYLLCLGRVGRVQPRALAMLVALGGFLGIYLVPFIKYPANPPSVGRPETIQDRGFLYLTMVGCSIAFLIAAVWLGQRIRARFGTWNATLLAGLAFAVAIGIVMAVLPVLGHLPYNQRTYGNQSTETPLPLTNPQGAIVYPGFPADVLFSFRFYSVAAQLILWSTIGLVFGPLAERLLRPVMRTPDTQPSESPDPVAV